MKKHEQTILCISLLLLSVIIVSIPLFLPGFVKTDDGGWMVIRLTSFSQSLRDGQFPVRFLSRLNNNYGYPVSNFLYPGYLYVGSVIRLFGVPFTTIIESLFVLSIATGSVFLFLWLRRFFRLTPSFFGALSFIVSPYLLFDVYARGSVGEVLAICLVIILFYCMEAGLLYLIPPVMGLFMISHNTTVLLFSVVLIFYIFIRKNWNAIIPLIIGCIMASFFLVPAIMERSFTWFDRVTVANPFDYIARSRILLLASVPFIVPVFFIGRQDKRIKGVFLFFVALVFLVFAGASGTGSIFFQTEFYTKFIQFPFRLLIILTVVGPWLISYAVAFFEGKKQYVVGSVLTAILCFGSAPIFFNTQREYFEEGYYTTNEGTTTVKSEYMPIWVKQQGSTRANEKIEFFKGKGNVNVVDMSTRKIRADVTLFEDSIVQFNTVYYPGWGATIDAKPELVHYDNPKGLMRLPVPKGAHAVEFEFRETGPRYIADVISSIGFFLYLAYLTWYFFRKKIRRKKP